MRVIDSHTAGEPTRVIVEGGPQLGQGSLAERAERFARDHKDFCTSVLLEPRGHDALVGALLVPPSDPRCTTGVIFFNPVGNLGMCGHAAMGLTVTLAHMGRITPGAHLIETPVGIVEVNLIDDHTVCVLNVESYRHLADVTIEVEELGRITGDVAWGGNWFFLTDDCPLPLDFKRIPDLTDAAQKIRRSLHHTGITGRDGEEIDHIEFNGPPLSRNAHARNFVLCPGGAYDRSPCGTGCSAKIACLAADSAWRPGDIWVQESIIDSTYSVSFQPGSNGGVIPTIKGQAFVTSEAKLIFSPDDPYISGIKP